MVRPPLKSQRLNQPRRPLRCDRDGMRPCPNPSPASWSAPWREVRHDALGYAISRKSKYTSVPAAPACVIVTVCSTSPANSAQRNAHQHVFARRSPVWSTRQPAAAPSTCHRNLPARVRQRRPQIQRSDRRAPYMCRSPSARRRRPVDRAAREVPVGPRSNVALVDHRGSNCPQPGGFPVPRRNTAGSFPLPLQFVTATEKSLRCKVAGLQIRGPRPAQLPHDGRRHQSASSIVQTARSRVALPARGRYPAAEHSPPPAPTLPSPPRAPSRRRRPDFRSCPAHHGT